MELTKRDKLILIAALCTLEWDFERPYTKLSMVINNSLFLQGVREPVSICQLITKLQGAL